MGESGTERTALVKAVDTALIPIHAAISKPAQRAYLGTFIFTATSIILFCASTIAYILFYYNYVPAVGLERTVHLQFGNGHPHGTASLSTYLVPLQPYDISLSLHLPRSPANLAAGNFMLDLALLAPSSGPLLSSPLTSTNASDSVLALSRRPAILTYTSSIVHTAHTLTGLPWYLLGWRKESEMLEVGMFEGVVFAKGWRNVPDKVQVIVEGGEAMHFYEMSVKVVARFGGLRYMLYNHRIFSFLTFTTSFFLVSLTSTGLFYAVLTLYMFPSHSQTPTSKLPSSPPPPSPLFNPLSTSDLSDTARSFPTLGHQPPLHFSKYEDEEQKVKIEHLGQMTGIQPLLGEADDEDDGEGDREEEEPPGFRDSGVGTSWDEGGRAGVQRRRRALFGGREGR